MRRSEKQLLDNIDKALRINKKNSDAINLLYYFKKELISNTGATNIFFDFYNLFYEFVSKLNFTDYDIGYIFWKCIKRNLKTLNDKTTLILIESFFEDLQEIVTIPREDLVELITVYAYDKELKNYQISNKANVIAELDEVLSKEKTYHTFLNLNYSELKKFVDQPEKKEEDYQHIHTVLERLTVPAPLIECFFAYMRSLSSKQEIKISFFDSKKEEEKAIPPKKVLKEQLKSYYDGTEYNSGLSFDYGNLEHLLFLLKYLNFTDERKALVLNTLFQNPVENYAYYDYLYRKNAFISGEMEEARSEIIDAFQSMMICSPEEYLIWKKYILENFGSFLYPVTQKIDYELELMKKL